MGYWRAQIAEVEGDRGLQIFGSALAFIHILTAGWWVQFGALRYLSGLAPALCWPHFDSCYLFRFPGPAYVAALFAVYVLMAAAAIAAFWRRRVSVGFALSAFLLVFKILLFTLDFRMRGNHHYLGFLGMFFFLFVPEKRKTIPYLVVSMYLAASLLKFNDEWLSGAALSADGNFPLTGKWVEWGCAYVLFLETLVVWGLLTPRTRPLFWICFAQFVAFHLISLPVVFWFYPSVMACLLSIFLLRKESVPFPAGAAARAGLAFFWALQILPLAYEGDTGLSGESRFLALNMMDTRTMCKGLMVATKNGRDRVEIEMPVMKFQVRIWCHPLVFYNFARARCREGARSGRWDNLDFMVLSKRSRASEWTVSMRTHDFCSDPRAFPLIAGHPWAVQ